MPISPLKVSSRKSLTNSLSDFALSRLIGYSVSFISNQRFIFFIFNKITDSNIYFEEIEVSFR